MALLTKESRYIVYSRPETHLLGISNPEEVVEVRKCRWWDSNSGADSQLPISGLHVHYHRCGGRRRAAQTCSSSATITTSSTKSSNNNGELRSATCPEDTGHG